MFRYKNKTKRIYLDNYFYFVTVKTFNNKSIFKNKDKADIFWQALMFVKQRKDFKLAAGVLLPNHFHLLLMPINKNISEIMHDLKSYTANQLNRKDFSPRRGTEASPLMGVDNIVCYNKSKSKHLKRRGVSASPGFALAFIKIWQRSFYYHIITNDWDFENHYHYIIYNPQKHNYTFNYDSWPWLWQGDV